MKQLNLFFGNIVLPVIWMILTGSYTVVNFLIGFAVSSVSLWLISSPSEVAFVVYLQRLYKLAGFFLFFIKELILANLKVAWEVITPADHMRPAIIAIPLDTRNDLQTTILANFITLTPGTLSLDVLPERNTLYIHAMYVDDEEAFRQDIKQNLERRVIEVFP